MDHIHEVPPPADVPIIPANTKLNFQKQVRRFDRRWFIIDSNFIFFLKKKTFIVIN